MLNLAQLPGLVGLTWKQLFLLLTVGVASGLALVLIKSLPVS